MRWLMLLLLHFPMAAGTYWVSPTGASAWTACQSVTPLAGAAACVRTTANTNAVAGDVVYFRGGTYTIAGSGLDFGGIQPANSGTDGNVITFARHADEAPIITGPALTYGIYLDGKSYIKIDGITFQNVPTYGYIIKSSHHNEIANCTFTSTSGNFGQGIHISGTLSCGTLNCWNTHNWIHHNTIERRVQSDPCIEGVDLIRIGSAFGGGNTVEDDNYNTVEDNMFAHAAHTVVDNFGRFTVLRNNISHNEPWLTGCTNYQSSSSVTSLAVGTGSKALTVETGKSYAAGQPIGIIHTDTPANAMAGTVTSYNSGTGALVVNVTYSVGSGTHTAWTISQKNYPYYENAVYNGLFGHRNFQLSDDYGRDGTFVLVEGNRLGHAGANPGNAGPMNLDAAAPKNIIRYNWIFNGMASGIYFKYANSAFLPCDGVRTSNGDCGGVQNRVYHNTLYRNGHGFNARVYGHMNNAYNGQGIAQWNASGTGTTQNVIKNNLLYENAEGDICALGLNESPCAAEAWDTVVSNWVTTDGNPLFVNPDVSDPSSATLPNLALQSSSPAIDGATHLTQANGIGSNSTTLIVDDALYFQDGSWGSDLARGVTLFPDWIAIGSVSNTVRISSIDYATNTITLAQPMTWSDNAPIWLYKKSDGSAVLHGTAPDYGAHEWSGYSHRSKGRVKGRVK